MKVLILIFAIAAVAAFVISGSVDAEQVVITSKEAKSFTLAITQSDFVCPSVNLVWQEPMEPRGQVFKVHCGPPGTADVYEKLVYRLIITPSHNVLVAPWDD